MPIEINQNEAAALKKAIENSDTIVIIAHKNPDGDAFGSTLALNEYLESIGKHSFPVTVGPVNNKYQFMRGIEKFHYDFDPNKFDLVISCDSGAEHMTGFNEKYPALFLKNEKLVNIDHHTSNNHFGGINIVDTHAPSTTAILYKLFRLWNIEITKPMACNLLTGITTDTGGFMHANTTPESYRIAADLVRHGGNINTIKRRIFQNKKIPSLKIWGKVFENININKDGVVISAITESDLRECEAQYDDLSGVVDYINTIPEAKYALLLAEKEDLVKGSLRTQQDIDLDQIAGEFGGGGHKKAAGFALPGKLEKEVSWKIIPQSDGS